MSGAEFAEGFDAQRRGRASHAPSSSATVIRDRDGRVLSEAEVAAVKAVADAPPAQGIDQLALAHGRGLAQAQAVRRSARQQRRSRFKPVVSYEYDAAADAEMRGGARLEDPLAAMKRDERRRREQEKTRRREEAKAQEAARRDRAIEERLSAARAEGPERLSAVRAEVQREAEAAVRADREETAAEVRLRALMVDARVQRDAEGALVSRHGKRVRVERPVYRGPEWMNRFHIAPGHRWDGVDRGTGWETKVLQHHRARRDREQRSYEMRTEDM
jgi:pre-mRNA-splicing factor CWC26